MAGISIFGSWNSHWKTHTYISWWRLLMVIDGPWWFLMVIDGFWWLLMAIVGFMMVSWWFLMVIDSCCSASPLAVMNGFEWDSHSRNGLTHHCLISGYSDPQVGNLGPWGEQLSMGIPGSKNGDPCHISGLCKGDVGGYTPKECGLIWHRTSILGSWNSHWN